MHELMTREEFMEEMTKSFGAWAGPRERRPLDWWLALEEYAKERFYRAYNEEYPPQVARGK